MCASSSYQSFKTQLDIFSAKLIAPSFLGDPKTSHENALKRIRGIKKCGIGVYYWAKYSSLLFLNQYLLSKLKLWANPQIWVIFIFSDNLVPIFSCVNWCFKRNLAERVWQERGWVGPWNFGRLKKYTFLPQVSKNQNVSAFLKKITAREALQSLGIFVEKDFWSSPTPPLKIEVKQFERVLNEAKKI